MLPRIKEAAARLGFDTLGVTSVAPLARDDEAFRRWSEAGMAAGMEYMTRRPELNAHPARLVPHAASVITFAINYYAAAPPFMHERRYGRVARYAWGLDYHDVVKRRLLRLLEEIERMAGRPLRARAFVDAVPLLERALGARSGLGFFGKNTNLIRPREGSWFFLSELLLDMELPSSEVQTAVSCGTCHRCIDNCPTEAFAGPHVLDSRRCVSYLTIENKGPIPRELRPRMREWVFGCDACQEMTPGASKEGRLPVIARGESESVCPFNRFAKETAWKEFNPEAGVGPRLDLVETLSIQADEEFRARFKGTPLTRPKRRGLLRNAAIVAANVGCDTAVPALVNLVENDPEPLIRSHALWAIAHLDPRRAARLIEKSLADPDPQVHEEALNLTRS